MRRGGGINLQISEVPVKIVLEQFLLEATIKSVGALDTNLNNVNLNYLTMEDAVATPWHSTNPLKAMSYPEGYLNVADLILIYPMDPVMQKRIKLMVRSEQAVFYAGPFAIRGDLSMGDSMSLADVMDSLDKPFLTATNVSIFPMFQTQLSIPETMPVALLNKHKITFHHGVGE